MMKKKALTLLVAVGIFAAGGITTYAAGNLFAMFVGQLKVKTSGAIAEGKIKEREELAAYKLDLEKRIEQETYKYMEKRFSEREKAKKKMYDFEANKAINEMKKHIDAELQKEE